MGQWAKCFWSINQRLRWTNSYFQIQSPVSVKISQKALAQYPYRLLLMSSLMGQVSLSRLGWFGTDFKTFLGILEVCIAPFGVRRGPDMIVSHRAPSSLNMSPYRAIWTHFRSKSMILEQHKNPEINTSELPDFWKIYPYSSGIIFPKVVRLKT